MQNRYAGPCAGCGDHVPEGAGTAVQESGRWKVRCAKCSGTTRPCVEARVEGARLVTRPLERLGDARFATYQQAIAGAEYDREAKTNTMPLARGAVALAALKTAGFEVVIAPEDIARLQAEASRVASAEAEADETARAIDAKMRGEGRALFPFQVIGARWLAGATGAILADDMGLGKTVQAIAALPSNARAVVVGPKVARGVWKKELKRWREGEFTFIAADRETFRWPEKPGEVVYITYHGFSQYLAQQIIANPKPGEETLKSPPPNGVVVVADEAQYVRNMKAAMSERFAVAAAAVRAKGGRVWELTATPMDNQPFEMWTLLGHAGLQRVAFPGGFHEFIALFGGVKRSFGGYDFIPSRRDGPEIARRLARVILRRMKDDVLKDLPPKVYQAVPVELDAATKKLCDMLWTRRAEWEEALLRAATTRNAVEFEQLSQVRESLGKLKLAAAIEWAEGYEAAEEPVVVFCASKDAAETLGSREGWALITGDTSADKRAEIETAFQRGDYKGVAGTIRAMGVALTLTRACTVAFIGLDWNPGWNRQAEDRVRRIGQHRPITVVTFVAEHRIDERMTEILQEKEELVRSTTDAARVGATVVPRTTADVMKDALAAFQPQPAEVSPGKARKVAETDEETWIVASVEALRQGPRLNAIDGAFCDKIAADAPGGLTETQYRTAKRLLARYGVTR